MDRDCDVVVIGGGPAGSCITTRLAKKGWHVVLLEKKHHPRFHIGESLLPYSLPYLENLGVLAEVDRIGLKKYGIELISPRHGRSTTLYFADSLDEKYAHAYQVMRSEFDEILLRNAILTGAQVQQGMSAAEVDFRSPSVLIKGIDHSENKVEWKTRFVVDATGRDALLSNRLGRMRHDKHHNSVAIFNHFEGVKRHSGKDEGNITVCWFEHGWFWIIPMKGGVTSVGAVCWPHYLKGRTGPLDDFFWETIKLCSPVADRLKGAVPRMQAIAAANFSYRSRLMRGDRFIVVGDAFAFVDPVFSSGVHFALNSAFEGAEVVDAYLRRSSDFHKRALKFERSVKRGLAGFSWFIYRFNQPAFEQLFMDPRENFRRAFHMDQAIISLLAGDVFRKRTIEIRLWLFKTIYFIVCLLIPRQNFDTYRLRKRSVTERIVEQTNE
jgi:flavin-dependent dehydrogenase